MNPSPVTLSLPLSLSLCLSLSLSLSLFLFGKCLEIILFGRGSILLYAMEYLSDGLSGNTQIFNSGNVEQAIANCSEHNKWYVSDVLQMSHKSTLQKRKHEQLYIQNPMGHQRSFLTPTFIIHKSTYHPSRELLREVLPIPGQTKSTDTNRFQFHGAGKATPDHRALHRKG